MQGSRPFGVEPDNINADTVCDQLRSFDRPRMAAWVRGLWEFKVADSARERELEAEIGRLSVRLQMAEREIKQLRGEPLSHGNGMRRAPAESDG